MSRIFWSSLSRNRESVPSSPAETIYNGHLRSSEIPSAVNVLPVPGGPWRTAKSLQVSHSSWRWVTNNLGSMCYTYPPGPCLYPESRRRCFQLRGICGTRQVPKIGTEWLVTQYGRKNKYYHILIPLQYPWSWAQAPKSHKLSRSTGYL